MIEGPRLLLRILNYPTVFRPGHPIGSSKIVFLMLFQILTTLAGSSLLYDLDTLHTRRSPSFVCEASISDFCLDEEACQARLKIGDGPLEVVRLCRIVNLGWSVAIKREPFWYLCKFFQSGCVRAGGCHKRETDPMAKVLQSAAGAMAETAI